MTSNPPPLKEGQAQTAELVGYTYQRSGEQPWSIVKMYRGAVVILAETYNEDNAKAIVQALKTEASHERLKQALEEYVAAEDQHTDAMLCMFDESMSHAKRGELQNAANSRLRDAKIAVRTALRTAHSVNKG